MNRTETIQHGGVVISSRGGSLFVSRGWRGDGGAAAWSEGNKNDRFCSVALVVNQMAGIQIEMGYLSRDPFLNCMCNINYSTTKKRHKKRQEYLDKMQQLFALL